MSSRMGCSRMGYRERSTIRLLGDSPAGKFVKVPKELLLDVGLTADARLVAVYLLSLSDGWEVSQRSIATALGFPKKSKRVGNALKLLAECGWLQRNDYTDGNRVYKYEYVMNRSRKVNAVKTTALYADESTASYKDHSNGGSGEPPVVREDPWKVGA